MENYKEDYINECKNEFKKDDTYEICITVKPKFHDKGLITTKTHLEIYNLIEKKIKTCESDEERARLDAMRSK